MQVGNTLSLSVSQRRRDYDEACKLVLADRQIRARILQAYVPEFASLGLDSIEALLGEEVQIGEEPVGREARVAWLTGEDLNTEDAAVGEGTARFDVRFSVAVPGEGEVLVEIDLEAQSGWSVGYPLPSRAVFYCARMLSAQGARILPRSDYGGLRKVYSLWVCSRPDVRHRGRVDSFAVQPIDPASSEVYDGYDLMGVTMVCLDGDKADAAYGCLGLLSALFARESDPAELKRSLVEDFGMILTEQIDERTEAMCNFSEGVWADGKAEGRAEGRAEAVRNLVVSLSFTIEKAMDVLGVPADEREECARMVAAM